MVTRVPAEQNPAVDPELPQPPTTIPGPPVRNPAPLSPLVPTDVDPFGPVTNVVVEPALVPLVPTDVNPFGPVTNVVVEPPPVDPAVAPGPSSPFGGAFFNDATARAPTPVAPGATSPFGGAFFNDATARTPAPVDPAVDPGARSPFGGGAFNDAAARNPEAAVDAVAAAEAAQQAATEARLREQQAIQAQFQSPANGDWRVKLKLSPNATYLYKDGGANSILAPLAASDGVVFPYMPDIQTTYNANYDTADLTHSNYRGQFYKSSYVGDINITGTFTAQNTEEANYLLAVIHFFRSATKMFYGEKDSFRGAPPPLVYLFGLGQYQFNAHPCVIRSFNYSLPNDVDYIRTKPNNYNVSLNNTLPKTESGGNPISAVISRLRNALLPKGALPNVPQELITVSQSVSNIDNSTYVPTKISVTISLLPIQTRNQQSQQFSVKGFANGDLLKGGFW
jgi:hypothetical protein